MTTRMVDDCASILKKYIKVIVLTTYRMVAPFFTCRTEILWTRKLVSGERHEQPSNREGKLLSAER